MEQTMTLLQRQCRQRKAERQQQNKKPTPVVKKESGTHRYVPMKDHCDGIDRVAMPNTNVPNMFSKEELSKIYLKMVEGENLRYNPNARGLRCVIRDGRYFNRDDLFSWGPWDGLEVAVGDIVVFKSLRITKTGRVGGGGYITELDRF